jgi:predicted component of type VI protein secretion system
VPTDVQMRQASNRTFQRILASLSPAVALRYRHVEPQKSELEKRLDEARATQNWELVTQLSNELAKRERAATGKV